jgi:hypothetical protein
MGTSRSTFSIDFDIPLLPPFKIGLLLKRLILRNLQLFPKYLHDSLLNPIADLKDFAR